MVSCKLNLDKMRKQIARNCEDAQWIDIDRYDPDFVAKRDSFFSWFRRQMKLKHGNNVKEFSIFLSENIDMDKVRLQAVVVLYNPKRRKSGRAVSAPAESS